MVYVPEKEYDGPDSMSRYPVSALPSRLDDAVLSVIRVLDEETESPDPATIALTSAINQVQAVSTKRVEHETALDHKKSVQIVFCDISKAFDKCWHAGLIFKLKSYGVGGSLLSLFQNYLSDRYQRVVIQGQASELGLIEAGVPQGSVLGPLLFLTYINDLPAGVERNMKLYADDATVYINYTDANIAHDVISKDLKYIESWADQ